MRRLDTTYQFRVPKVLLEEFLNAARAKDRSAAGEIREFMRGYIKSYGQADDDDVDDFDMDDEDDPKPVRGIARGQRKIPRK